MFAAEKGHTDSVRLLVDAGAEKEAKNMVRVLCEEINEEDYFLSSS